MKLLCTVAVFVALTLLAACAVSYSAGWLTGALPIVGVAIWLGAAAICVAVKRGRG